MTDLQRIQLQPPSFELKFGVGKNRTHLSNFDSVADFWDDEMFYFRILKVENENMKYSNSFHFSQTHKPSRFYQALNFKTLTWIFKVLHHSRNVVPH